MKNAPLLSLVLPACLLLATTPGRADGTSFNITGNSTSAQSVGKTPPGTAQTGTISSTGVLTIGSSTVAISIVGNATINNSGTINQNGGVSNGRAIRDNQGGGLTLNVTNSGIIETNGDDAFQMNKAGDNVTLNNSGTISALGSSGQAIDWNALTSGANTLNNLGGGVITAANADAIRPGVNGIITNDGTIQSFNPPGGSGNDGIDAQTNSGVSITNANTNLSTNANLIEGAAHGITGGVTKTSSGGTFTMSVTNNSHGTIQGDDGSGINVDGYNANETVTINNAGTITGNGVTGDGDGVDVDGLVNLTNSGTIKSLNSLNDTSEGITVGGGTIVNTSTGIIEGSISTPTGNTGTGRGITLAGVDKDANGNATTIQKIYADTTVTNSGLIKGDSSSGISIIGIATTDNAGNAIGNHSVIITNNAGGTIEGNSATAAVIDGSTSASSGLSTPSANNETIINYGTIQQDGTGKAISLGSGVNHVTILGGAASINGDISGGTTAGTNALVIDPNEVSVSGGLSNQSFSYSHVLSNFATVEIASGTVNFSGANTYTGSTTIDANAMLNLEAGGSINDTSSISIAAGGDLNVDGGTLPSVTITGAGTVSTSSGTISGLNGTVGVKQFDSGTTSVTGTNGYTGATTVTAGKLDVSGTISSSTSTASGTGNIHLSNGIIGGVILNSGGSLTGNGTVGNLTVNSGGLLSPGNSPGLIHAGNTIFNSGGKMLLQVNTDGGTGSAGNNWDQLAISGKLDVSSLSAGSPFQFQLQTLDGLNASNPLAIFDATVDHTWNDIITTTGGFTGTFNSNLFTVDTSLFQNNLQGGTFQIVQDSSNPNNLDLQFVAAAAPEPSTWALLAGGLALLVVQLRRRRL